MFHGGPVFVWQILTSRFIELFLENKFSAAEIQNGWFAYDLWCLRVWRFVIIAMQQSEGIHEWNFVAADGSAVTNHLMGNNYCFRSFSR